MKWIYERKKKGGEKDEVEMNEVKSNMK